MSLEDPKPRKPPHPMRRILEELTDEYRALISLGEMTHEEAQRKLVVNPYGDGKKYLVTVSER